MERNRFDALYNPAFPPKLARPGDIPYRTTDPIPDGDSPELARKLAAYRPPFQPQPRLRDWFPPRTWPWLAALVAFIVVAVIKTL